MNFKYLLLTLVIFIFIGVIYEIGKTGPESLILTPILASTVFSNNTSIDPIGNLLINPGFETVSTADPNMPANWMIYYEGTQDSPFSYPEPGRIGGSSVALSFTVADIKEADWIQVVGGISSTNTYKISGWIHTQNVSTGDNNGATVHIDWFNSSQDYINTSRIIVPKIQGTTEWTYFEKYVTDIPADVASAHIVLKMLNATGKVWYDDMSFSKS